MAGFTVVKLIISGKGIPEGRKRTPYISDIYGPV